jgi:hypothetical protein
MIWLYRDTEDKGEVAALSWSILWVVVPSVAFFIALPIALRGMDFWLALLVACSVTAVTYAAWIGGARVLGFHP